MTQLDIIIRAAERTKKRLEDFADGKLPQKPLPESYHAVVQDIGSFGVFLEELHALRQREGL